MPFTLSMPKLSPTMESGVIAKWHKREGDYMEPGEVILEITTDKATVEHQALDEGWLRTILVPEGASATVNQAIAVCTAEKEESLEGYQPEGGAPEKKSEPAAEEGKKTAPSEVSEKKTDVRSFEQPLFPPEPPLQDYHFPFSEGETGKKILATPLAKKMAEEKNLDLSSVKGTGPNGRIRSTDLATALPATAITKAFSKEKVPPPGTFEEEKLSPVQMVVGERLAASKTFIPHFYINQSINVSGLMRLREELKIGGVKISFNDFLIKAVALALREHPKINSGYHVAQKSILRFKTVDISVAVSIESGLITPVIRYADYKNVRAISSEIKELARKARANALAPEEYKGGSFTISNLGMYGVTSMVPVINPPQGAILGVGGIENVPVVEGDRVVPGFRMMLTLAADHRIINGEDGAKFLKTLREFAENPSLLLL